MTTPNDPNQPPVPGQPPAEPTPGYGSPAGYGAPAGYGGPPAMPPAAYGGAELAPWGSRVLAALIDYFAPFIIAAILIQISITLGVIAYLAAFAWVIWNKVQEGNTGQSLGKKQAGTRLLREADGQVVGAGAAIGRWLLHIVDGIPCYLGYLWPLWDAKKQTFADNIMSTVVVKV